MLKTCKPVDALKMPDVQTAGRYSELVALYQQRGQHERALSLLHDLSQAPTSLPVPPQGLLLLISFHLFHCRICFVLLSHMVYVETVC